MFNWFRGNLLGQQVYESVQHVGARGFTGVHSGGQEDNFLTVEPLGTASIWEA